MKKALFALLLTTGVALAGNVPPPPAPSAVPPPPAPSKPANTFDYNYLEPGWIHNDIDPAGDGDGYYAGLSLAPIDHLILFANWAQVWGDDVDTRSLVVGAGTNWALGSKVDIVVKAGFGWADGDNELLTVDANSFVSSLGFRIALTDWLELAPSYVFAVSDGDTISAGAASLLFDIGTDVELSLNGGISDNDTSFGAGIRYHF